MVAPNSAHPCAAQSWVLRSLLSSATIRDIKQPELIDTEARQIISNNQLQQTVISPESLSLPSYSHKALRQAVSDHSAKSPELAIDDSRSLGQLGMPYDPSVDLSQMMTGIGQPGNPLVTSFLGGDEWSMLMTSLGLDSNMTM